MNNNEYVVERVNADANAGLNDDQVKRRIENKLVNQASQKYSKTYLNILVNNTCTFFNLLGLIVFLALIYIKAPLANFVFALVFLANMGIGIIQEIRAKKCIDRLSIVALKCVTVIRNGIEVEIPSKDIVLDDIIKLNIGDQIPTDCLLLEGNVEVNEALLTGESDPVKKNPGEYMLAGSFITCGSCVIRAIKVGKDNYVEKLTAKAKKYKKPKSELMDALKFFIKVIGFIIVPIATLYFIKSYVIANVSVNESILKTSTLVIGMIPSGMFLLTSLALAIGIIKLARHNTLVQDLYSLEMLARVDTICFDKTGTITDGNMTVCDIIPLNKFENYSSNDIIANMLNTLKDNNQTAVALYNYFGHSDALTAKAFLPFNSVRKLSAVTFDNVGTFAFGAPEFVLNKKQYSLIKDDINSYASKGYRVLVLAGTKNKIENDNLPTDFTPISLITIVDNIRADAIDTIKWFKDNDVAVKVISGDNPITVAEVSKRVGIPNADKFISLEGLTDEEVFKCANDYTVFGRVTPEQKAILIKALKSAGHVTAMTGDGVNDILALKEADCAISVAAGSEAAKNISHLVLLDNNFNSMPQIVYEGRRVINNIQSSASLYLMKTFFTMLVAITTFILPYIKTYPFELSQMNILEIFIIGVPSFMLSMQANDERLKGKFISYVINKSLPSSLLMFLSIALIEIFKVTLGTFPNEIYTTMQVLALTNAGTISLFVICKPLNKYRSALFFTSCAVIAIVNIYTIFFGLPMLNLVALAPFTEYWHHVLLLVTIIIIDALIIKPIMLLCSKIKIVKKKNSIN